MNQEFGETKNGAWQEEHSYSVEFLGGPLDGGEIVTDEYPNNDQFVHRFARREYLYKYRRTGPTNFLAEYDGLFVVASAVPKKASSKYKLFLGLLVPSLLIIGAIAWCILRAYNFFL